MAMVSIFSGTFCREKEVIDSLRADTDLALVTDRDLLALAEKISDMPVKKIERAMSAKKAALNPLTREKERGIAWLRVAVSKILEKDNLILSGFGGHLIFGHITHVLYVCLIANLEFRIERARKTGKLSRREATRRIRLEDHIRAQWVYDLLKKNDPWDCELYDMVIPMHRVSFEKAAARIRENLAREILRTTEDSRRAVKNFQLASLVELELIRKGHGVKASAKDGHVVLTIDKQVFRLSRLEKQLKTIAKKVPGVESVETRVGAGFHQSDIFRSHNLVSPPKLLLVDDERDFVQYLSERLLSDPSDSAVAFDGKSALEMVEKDAPEVMILDLKMPGIDGIDVLRRVKQTRPDIEVIILTGEGSEADQKMCMKLGAFAYLKKPVDIELLGSTLRRAHEKAHSSREKRRHPEKPF